MTERRDARRQQHRADLVARLERVRGNMTDPEFEILLADVERTATRFAEIDRGGSAHRRFPSAPDEGRPGPDR